MQGHGSVETEGKGGLQPEKALLENLVKQQNEPSQAVSEVNNQQSSDGNEQHRSTPHGSHI